MFTKTPSRPLDREAETSAIIAATETAASKRNYTSSRHTYATVDLPVAAVYADGSAHAAAAASVHKARNATINDLVHRCGATDPTLHDGFVIKYSTSRQAGLEQHGDGGRYSATIALSRPRRTGVHVPDYASSEPQTCELRKRGFANETCNAEFPERRIFQRTLLQNIRCCATTSSAPRIVWARVVMMLMPIYEVNVTAASARRRLRHGK